MVVNTLIGKKNLAWHVSVKHTAYSVMGIKAMIVFRLQNDISFYPVLNQGMEAGIA